MKSIMIKRTDLQLDNQYKLRKVKTESYDMKINDFIIICTVIVTMILITGCVDSIINTERFDVVEYDLTEEYFIYVDESGYINKISWDNSGWNSASSFVKIKQSDESYVERIIESDGAFSQTRYILYLNISYTPTP